MRGGRYSSAATRAAFSPGGAFSLWVSDVHIYIGRGAHVLRMYVHMYNARQLVGSRSKGRAPVAQSLDGLSESKLRPAPESVLGRARDRLLVHHLTCVYVGSY